MRPGVYPAVEESPRPAPLPTGVPVFLGHAPRGEPNRPVALGTVEAFGRAIGDPAPSGFLGAAVRGFFANGGTACHVVPLDPDLPAARALEAGIDAAGALEDVDLVCAPDITSAGDPDLVADLQGRLVRACDDGPLRDRLAILDALPGADVEAVLRQREALGGTNAALYHPWIRVAAPASTSALRSGPTDPALVPPCGHVAGVYARSDRRTGVHKAPANEPVEGALDLGFLVTDAEQDRLNAAGVNAIRAFPARGIRVWGARTLSRDPAWTYVNVRRVVTTARRWIEREMAGLVFEPNDARLWSRVGRELTGYGLALWRAGALRGATPAEAFYVRCDRETNPEEVRGLGLVVAELGLAPGLPSEFVRVRIALGEAASRPAAGAA